MTDKPTQYEIDKDARDLRIKRYEMLRDYAKHEDNLVNNRVMWILTIHGFLYATYGFSLQKKLEVVQKFEEASRMPLSAILRQGNSVARTLLELECFLFVLSGVGIAVSLLGYMSIHAAKEAVININAVFEFAEPPSADKKYEALGEVVDLNGFLLPTTAGGGTGFAKTAGSSASVRIPIFLAVSWCIALVVQAFTILT